MISPDEEPVETDGAADRGGRVRKAATAFRTISEVADDLHVPQHVLRFWENRFPQVKPLKRGGGRRYYRPDDVLLLRRISDLLYVQGYTIKGVQRLLIEGDGTLQGVLPPPDASDRDDEQDLPIPATPLFETPARVPAQYREAKDVASFGPAVEPDESSAVEALRPLLEEILLALEALRRSIQV